MTLVTQLSGCKVGWEVYDDEAEAKAAADRAAAERERKLARGYDFGWLWPGTVTPHEAHPKYGRCWIVVTP